MQLRFIPLIQDFSNNSVINTINNQENVERLEHELDEERGVRDKTEKLMRATEATLIEVKNDAIFANEQQV